jgi:hypothetical protein
MQQPKQTKHQGAAFAPYLHRGQIVPFKVRGVTAAYKREHTPSIRRNGLQQPVTLRSDATPISASSSKTLLQTYNLYESSQRKAVCLRLQLAMGSLQPQHCSSALATPAVVLFSDAGNSLRLQLQYRNPVLTATT